MSDTTPTAKFKSALSAAEVAHWCETIAFASIKAGAKSRTDIAQIKQALVFFGEFCKAAPGRIEALERRIATLERGRKP